MVPYKQYGTCPTVYSMLHTGVKFNHILRGYPQTMERYDNITKLRA